MVSSKRLNLVSFCSFFFLVLLLVAVSGDESEVDNACRKTPHPDICVSCINSDSSRSTSEIPELTYEILFCMMSEATNGHAEADLMVQKTGEPNLKQKLQTCNVSLFSATNSVTDSLMRMEGKDYRKAEDDLESANRDVISCEAAFLKQPIVTFPPQLCSHADMAARYYDVAHAFFAVINPKQS